MFVMRGSGCSDLLQLEQLLHVGTFSQITQATRVEILDQ